MEDKLHIEKKSSQYTQEKVLQQQIDGLSLDDKNSVHIVKQSNGNFEAELRTPEIGHHEERLSDLSDNDDMLTPNEELINAIKSNESEEEKVTKIKNLFEKDNKPNIRMHDKNYDTPLHISVRRTLLKVIEFLVNNGADVNIVNTKGKSPLCYAKKLKRQDIIEILETQINSKAKQSHQEISVIKLEDEQSENKDNTNVYNQNTGRNQGPIHGNIYQLKLLMLFLYRGVSNQYSFRLGIEEEEAKKFDDLVFECTADDRKEYRLLQTKHRLDESKKITADNLLTETDGDYSLTKYFFSYQDSINEKLFKIGSIRDVTICTNIDFDFENLKRAQIIVEKIQSKDDILDVKGVGKQPMRYRFNENIIPSLKSNILNYNLTKLAIRLAECVLENNPIKHHEKCDIFKSYHLALAAEVIDIKTQTFHKNFIEGRDLSKVAKQFRNSFIVEIERKSKEKLVLKHINKDLSNKVIVIGDKPIGLNLSKKFGLGNDRNWPSEVFSDSEIKRFLDHLVFAVNQPNEEELGKIIKREIGKGFNLDFVTTRNTYNEFFIQMLEWMQGKARGRFLTYEEGTELFEELRKGISFDVKDPVHSFTGRELELCDLHRKIQRSLEKTSVISQITSVSGLGGIGKTELARQYIHKHSKDYDDNIIWINAENEGNIFESFLRLAKDKLGIYTKDVEGNKKDIKSIVEEVYNFFKCKKCLFIFDNAEKNECFNKFLPLRTLTSKTYLLITSRNREWEQGIEVLKLDVLSLEDASKFVRKGLHIKDDSQDEEIQKLVEKLQCFPLAMQQAVSYICEETVTEEFGISNYLVEYENKTKELLDSKLFKGIDNDYARTTFTTWKITLAKIESHAEYGELALKLINIIAYFAPDNIYRELFLDLKDVNEKQLKFAVRLLVQYSMVNSEQKQSVLSIHRLVQELIRIYLNDAQSEADVLDEALGLLQKNKIDQNSVDHAVSVWGYSSKLQKLIKKFGDIPSCIVNILNRTLRYQEASSFGNSALELLDVVLGNEHDYVTYLQNNLAGVFYNQGKDNDALKIYDAIEKKRNITSITLLGKSRYILREDCRKGLILLRQGKLDKALEIFNQEYDLVQFGIMNSCGNIEHYIGITLMEQGKLQEASEMLQKSLKLKEHHLGLDDISVLDTKNSISTLLERQGKHEDSLKILKEVYEKRKDILGPTHPDTLATYWNFSLCLYYLKKYDQALKIAYEIEKEREKIIPDHPRVLKAKELIADILFAQNKLNESIRIYENVYEKRVNIMGEQHKDTLYCLFKTGLVLTKLQRYDEAVKQFESVFNGRKVIFGPNDKRTLEAKSALNNVLNGLLFNSVSLHNCNLNQVRTLLEKGADVNALKDENLTPLHLAAAHGNPGIVELLLRGGANVNAKDIYLATALHLAAERGHSKIVELLLNHGASINAKTYRQVTPLYISAQNGHPKIVRLLLNKGADIKAKNYKHVSALYIAAENNHTEIVEKLLKAGASTNTKIITDGFTPLHIAAQNGNCRIFKMLLCNGANVNAKNLKQATPLHLAIFYGNIDIAKILLKQGAKINVKDKNWTTPLHLAADKGHVTLVAALLNKGANANSCDIALFRPLHFAAQEGHVEIVKALLMHKADIEANCTIEMIEFNKDFISKNTCVMGLTALHVAASNGHIGVIRALLEAGANIEAINELNKTPAETTRDPLIKNVILSTKKLPDAIRQNQNPSVIQHLIEDGAVINHYSNTSRLTALHYAVSRGSTNILRLLLSTNPNVNVPDEDGWTPLHYAAQDGYVDIVQLLLDKGANAGIKNSHKQTSLDTARAKLVYDPHIYQKIIDILLIQLHERGMWQT